MTKDEATALLAATFHQIAPEVDLCAIDPDLPLQEVAGIDSADFLTSVAAIHDRHPDFTPGLSQAGHAEAVRLLLDAGVRCRLTRHCTGTDSPRPQQPSKAA